eukprot:6447574-Pyramimonas_sp.AAC.1
MVVADVVASCRWCRRWLPGESWRVKKACGNIAVDIAVVCPSSTRAAAEWSVRLRVSYWSLDAELRRRNSAGWYCSCGLIRRSCRSSVKPERRLREIAVYSAVFSASAASCGRWGGVGARVVGRGRVRRQTGAHGV